MRIEEPHRRAPRVRDQHVDAAEALERGAGDAGDPLGTRDVGRHGVHRGTGAPGNRLGRLRQRSFTARADREGGPFVRERLGDRAAEALARGRDQRDLPREAGVHAQRRR